MKTNITKSAKAGFTLVEIMIVVAIIGLLAAIAIPNFVRARDVSSAKACIANLKQIDGAKHQWAIENKKQPADVPEETDLYGKEKYIREEPECPLGGEYTIGAVQVLPTCSIGKTRSATEKSLWHVLDQADEE